MNTFKDGAAALFSPLSGLGNVGLPFQARLPPLHPPPPPPPVLLCSASLERGEVAGQAAATFPARSECWCCRSSTSPFGLADGGVSQSTATPGDSKQSAAGPVTPVPLHPARVLFLH